MLVVVIIDAANPDIVGFRVIKVAKSDSFEVDSG